MQDMWRFRGSVYVKAICILLVFCAISPSLGLAAQGVDYNFGAERTSTSVQPKMAVDSFDGSFSYDFPLTLPPGRNGMEPSLSLGYSSKNTEQISSFGYGWSINIPYIERINKYGLNKIYTTTATSSFFSSLDGELQATSSATTTEWGALDENGDFRKYEYRNGYWTVTDKKGTIYKFGTSSLSQLVNSASSTQLSRWMLDEVRDRNGNYVKYEYYKDSNQIYPYKIKYTGNGTTDGLYEIEFTRETRTDVATSSKTGFQVVSKQRIREIDIKVNGTLSKSYKLGFTTGNNGYRSLLNTIVEAGKAEVGGATSTMPTTTLSYAAPTRGWTLNSAWHMPEYFVDETGIPATPQGDMGTRFEDFNGDGLPDILKAREGSTSIVYLNRGNGSWGTTTPVGIKAMVSTTEGGNSRAVDINGDGLADFVTGSASSSINTNRGGSFVGSTTWQSPIDFVGTISGVKYDDSGRILDFNGDGLVDMARAYGSSTNQANENYKNGIYLNNGAGWNGAATTSPALPQLSNLISYWKFDESSGTSSDTRGSNNLTNINSTSYATGKINNGIDYELSSGQRSLISDANQSGLDITGDFSISLWVKAETVSAINRLVGKYDSSVGTNAGYAFRMGTGATGLCADLSSNGTSGSAYCVNWTPSAGTWYYLTVTYNGSAKQLVFYVNGASQGTKTTTQGSIFNNSAPFCVGNIQFSDCSDVWNHDGLIDELGIWNVTLTPIEISQLYNSGTGAPYSIGTTTGWGLPAGKYFAGTDTTVAGIDDGARFADFDGDGLTDILYSREFGSTPYNYMYFNNGDGTWTQTTPSGDFNSSGPTFSPDTGLRLADVNGDGLVDVINTLGADGNVVYLNKDGRTFTLDSAWNAVPDKLICNGSPPGCGIGDDAGGRFVDIDSDGMVDIVRSDGTGVHGGEANETFLHNGATPADLLTGITSNTIGNTTVTYKSTAEYKDSNGNLFNPALPINFQTVSTISSNNKVDPSVIATTTYTYGGGEYLYTNPFDRKFAGFATTTVTDPYGNVTKTYSQQGNGSQTTLGEYNDSRSKIGKPYRVETYSGTSTLYTTKISKWDSASLSNGRTFVFKTRDLQLDYDGNSTHKDKVGTYEYDSTNGNLLTVFDYGEVSGSDDGSFATGTAATIRTTRYTYIASSTPNIFGLPKSVATFNSSNATTSEQRLYYDSLALGSVDKGNLTKDERLATSSIYLSNQYAYNSYGLPTSQTDPRNKTTSYTYNNNLFVATTTNAANQVIEIFRDLSSGKATKTVDPNGLVFETIYDGLDRPIEQKVPDHLGNASTSVTAVTYEYTDTVGLHGVKQTNYLNSATSSEKYTYFDGYKRKIQERTEGESSYMVKDWEYDLRGQLKKETLPYFNDGPSRTAITSSSSLLVSYGYDTLGRLATTTNVKGTATTTYNKWMQTSTDLDGKIKDYVYDAFGNLTAVGERKSGGTATTTYAYDAQNNLSTTTDASSNIRTFSYDKLSRLLKATDLHTTADTGYGVHTYTYDAGGNLATTTDSKSQTVEYLFDDLNRVLSENFTGVSGTEVQYSYDTCKWGKGKLCAATTTESVTRTDYDAAGNIATSTRIINNATSTTLFAYDRSKNITKVTYPNNIRANYEYNASGLLEQLWLLTGTTTIPTWIATSTEYGPSGQVTARSLGNGYTTNYTFDSSNLYRLTSLVTSPGVATTTTSSQTQGLVSWWTFNNNANDSHTSSNNLTTTGSPTYTTGKLGNAIDIGGPSQYASISDASQTGLDVTSDFSIGLWIKYDTVTDIHRLIGKFDSSGGTNAGYALHTTNNPSAGLCADLSQTGSTVNTYCVPWTTSTATWYYLAMTFDGGRQEVKFYVNGSQQGSTQPTSESAIYNNTAPFCVAQLQGCADIWGHDGLIDEAAIWSGRVLSASEISDLYNSGNGKTYSDLSTTSISIIPAGRPIQNLSYTYDNVGNITAITDNSIGGTARRTTFIYDDLHRMTNASTTAASSTPFTQTYAYDSLGSITSGPLGSYSYAGTGYANPHAATTINGVTYTYDNNGNLATSSPNVYYWNYRDRLTKSSNGTATTTYAYDENNSRVRKTILGTATTTYPNAYYNYSSTGSTTAHILLPDGTPIATVEAKNGAATSTYWLHLDHLGGIQTVTNASGTQTQTLDYYPYGDQRIASSSGAFTEQRQYIGKEYDSDSDLDYLEARYYSGEKARFLSQDPVFNGLPKQQNLANPQSLNSYNYAEGNPIIKKDPTGLAVYLAASEVYGTGNYHTYYYVSPEETSKFSDFGPFTLEGGPSGWLGTGNLQANLTRGTSNEHSDTALTNNYTKLTPPRGQTEDDLITGLARGHLEVATANIKYRAQGNIPGQKNGNSNNYGYTLAEYAGVSDQFKSFTSLMNAPGKERGVPLNSKESSILNALARSFGYSSATKAQIKAAEKVKSTIK